MIIQPTLILENILKPRKALNKAYLKVKPYRESIEQFKENLIQLIDRSNDTESEKQGLNIEPLVFELNGFNKVEFNIEEGGCD